jgi:hypothetical protein
VPNKCEKFSAAIARWIPCVGEKMANTILRIKPEEFKFD